MARRAIASCAMRRRDAWSRCEIGTVYQRSKPEAPRPASLNARVRKRLAWGQRATKMHGMPWHEDSAYAALLARDARFDGQFFVGVTSTHIYCRPVCRVRVPMRKNCRFYGNAAQAEADGFRPCLRCRPELAPGLSLIDSPHALADHAAKLLERAARHGDEVNMESVAKALGVTTRHMRRIFALAHGVTPIDYLTTSRLLFAKHLLTDTQLPVTQVAMASGFGSLRRFNASFLARYRMAPTALRKQVVGGGSGASHRDSIDVRLAFRPPYDVQGVMKFFHARALVGIESVDMSARTITRSLTVGSHTGWVRVEFLPTDHRVKVSLSPSLLPVLGRAIDQVRHALDLDAQPDAIARALQSVPAPQVQGLRLPGCFDGFEATVRIILGQQVTVAAARTLAQRLVAAFGRPLATPHDGIVRLFPTPQALAQASDEAIGTLGIVKSRVRAIKAVAQAVILGDLALDRDAPLQATLATLQALPGIGEWTAQLVALRVLAWPDAFPAADIGVLRALGLKRPAAAQALAVAWQPYRSYAVMQLWQSLETGT